MILLTVIYQKMQEHAEVDLRNIISILKVKNVYHLSMVAAKEMGIDSTALMNVIKYASLLSFELCLAYIRST